MFYILLFCAKSSKSKFQLINVEGMRELGKSSFVKHRSNNCCMQDLSMNAKIRNLEEKLDLSIVWKSLTQDLG